MNSVEHNNTQEIRALIERQQKLEEELGLLKTSLRDVEKNNKQAIYNINSRIDKLETELIQLSQSIDNVVSSVGRVQQTVNSVFKTVGKIEGKQDTTILAQEKFISQLWKAFFVVLTIVVTGTGIIFNIVK